jgi:cytochrome c2
MSRIPFLAVILALGVVMLVFVFVDVWVRGPHRFPEPRDWSQPGDPRVGRQLVVDYGCGACHVIPGVREATGRVGPKLEDLRNQIYIAGRLANTPENLAAWIENPQAFDPLNAMPNLGVTAEESQHMAAYLMRYTSRRGR